MYHHQPYCMVHDTVITEGWFRARDSKGRTDPNWWHPYLFRQELASGRRRGWTGARRAPQLFSFVAMEQ